MTTWNLFGSTPGPSSPAPYAGPFVAGIAWKPTEWGKWLAGYRFWCPLGGDTGPQKFALWQIYGTLFGSNLAALIPGSVVTSGTLTPGAWNTVMLSRPIPLSSSVPYIAATGWTAALGFPYTGSQFGSGQVYANGITSGPLFAYSDGPGTAPMPSNWGAQGLFSTSGSDPSVTVPTQGDTSAGSANFWMDVVVTDTPPPGVSLRLTPNYPVPLGVNDDTPDPFTLATEFTLSAPASLNKIWFYSKSGYTLLPAECGIFSQSSHALVAGTHVTSPSWSGAAGSGWISQSYSGVTLQPGSYRVAVCSGATSTIWNMAVFDYFGTGPASSGIANGILSAPSEATADSPGQSSYNAGASLAWPGTYAPAADGSYYGVDVEVTPAAASGSGLLMAGGII